jgi:uncharacterized protein YjbI with pentapeptide repeats
MMTMNTGPGASRPTLQAYDAWRRGGSGGPVGLKESVDRFAHAGLNLSRIHIASSVFAGSSFHQTRFQDARWQACTFDHCHFHACDFDRIFMNHCSFKGCTFSDSHFRRSALSDCRFTQCAWTRLCFDHARWRAVQVLECEGHDIGGDGLQGQWVDLTGSRFEGPAFGYAQIGSLERASARSG